MRKSHVEKLDIPLNFVMFTYALIKVACARASLNCSSPNVWFKKNRRTGDWYFLTSWSKARLLWKTATCVTRAMSLSSATSLLYYLSRRPFSGMQIHNTM